MLPMKCGAISPLLGFLHWEGRRSKGPQIGWMWDPENRCCPLLLLHGDPLENTSLEVSSLFHKISLQLLPKTDIDMAKRLFVVLQWSIESQNHRMVWVGKALKDHLILTTCHGQGHLPLDQVAQSPVQPGLETCYWVV